MKIIGISLILIFASFNFLSASWNKGKTDKKKITIIEGVVEAMAPPVPATGVLASYRLVKYKVSKVCKGSYKGEQIVVDHYITTEKELENIEVGDRVYVPVYETNKLDRRLDYHGIREPRDIVNKYYLGFRAFLAGKPNCSYNESDLLYIKN